MLMTSRATKLLLMLFFLLSISACGGGSGDSNSTTAESIVVTAGANISLDESDTASITGGASGGTGTLSFAWQADASVGIDHPDTSIADATLTAPVVTTLSEYSISLVATDENGVSASRAFILTVNPLNELPVADITSNDLAGYASNHYPVTSTIILDGSGSSDADPQISEAAISSYLWQQIAGPGMLAGIDSTQSSISFAAPTSNTSQTATFRLTVSDQESATDSTEISITLLAQSLTLPEAQVSDIRDVFAGEIQALTGAAQSLAPDASPFTAVWSASESAQINDATAFVSYATAPLVSDTTQITYTLNIEDSFRNTASAQTSAQVFAPMARTINDTGISNFANNSRVLSNYQAEFAGQDADFGADRQVLSGLVIKVGDGQAGFDFTRLDSSGDAVDNPSFNFDCVRDNVTGLIWQTKDIDDASSIEYADQLFTWYSEDENGNFAGDLNEASSQCNVATAQCNTQAYIDQINAQGVCGFFDWRLPDVQELQSIVHYGKTSPPLVDTVFFPYWGGANSQTLWYWTSQSSADGVSNDIAQNAWAIDMNSGTDGFLLKTSERRVILVRAGR